MTFVDSQIVEIAYDVADAPLIEIHWILTRRCQYSCWYCPPHRHDPKAQHADERALIEALARVVQYLATKPARINLTGGEPTLHTGFLAFVRTALTAKPIRAARIVTNLAGPLPIFKALADLNRHCNGVQVVASFHPDRARPKPFMDRVDVLSSAGVPVLIKILGRGEGGAESDKILEDLQRVGIPTGTQIMVQRIRQSSSENSTRPPLGNELLRQWGDSRVLRFASGESGPLDAEELIATGANRFLGWKCDAGCRSLFIDSDGSFHAALCRPRQGTVPNIFNSADELPAFDSVLCPHTVCGCASTIRIPKRIESGTPRPIL